MPRNQSEKFPEADDLTFPFPDAPHQDVNPKFHARIFWNLGPDGGGSRLGKSARRRYTDVCDSCTLEEAVSYMALSGPTYCNLRNFYRKWWIAYLDRWGAAGHAA